MRFLFYAFNLQLETVDDATEPVEAILKRCNKQQVITVVLHCLYLSWFKCTEITHWGKHRPTDLMRGPFEMLPCQ